MKTLLLFFVLVFGLTESARATTRTCDSCSSTKVLQLANSVLIPGAYTTPRQLLYIVDTVTGNAYKYRYRYTVTHVPGYGDGDEIEVTSWVEELPAESELKSAMLALAAVRGPTDFFDTSGPDLPTSAYDTAITPALYVPMSDWLVQHQSVNLAHQLIGLGSLVLPNFSSSGVVLQVVWHYPDGTTETLQFDRANNRYTPVPDTARDRNGNIIPKTRLDFSGGNDSVRVHIFEPISNINDFLVRAGQLGVPVTNGNAPRPPGTRTVITCVTAGGATTCVAQTVAI